MLNQSLSLSVSTGRRSILCVVRTSCPSGYGAGEASDLQDQWTRRIERYRHTASRASFRLLLIAVTTLPVVLAPDRTAGRVWGAEPPTLTQTEKRIVRKFEKELTTRLNSKDNPGDQNTWYVIVFTDTALGTRQSRSVSGDYLTITREMQVRGNSAAKIAQGREAAALLLAQYYYAENSAATKLRPTVGGSTDWARAMGAKDWRYRAFAKEADAKAFFDRVNPKKKPERP